jgi:hypothetical protein
MSRSRRKSPVRGITSADSDKGDKLAAHRKSRRVVRIAVRQQCEVLPHARELSDPWGFDKDGKARFDPNLEPASMRK